MVFITSPCDYCWEMVEPRCINFHRMKWSISGIRLFKGWRCHPHTAITYGSVVLQLVNTETEWKTEYSMYNIDQDFKPMRFHCGRGYSMQHNKNRKWMDKCKKKNSYFYTAVFLKMHFALKQLYKELIWNNMFEYIRGKKTTKKMKKRLEKWMTEVNRSPPHTRLWLDHS